jgi:guanine deaminase
MHETFLREAIRLASEGAQRGDGGPFGSVIVLDGQIVGRGWNQVLATNDPTAHAEVVASRDACARLGTYQLSNCIVYAGCEPCPMCLAACYWLQAGAIIYGATALDAANAGFTDDFIRRDLLEPVTSRQLRLEQLLHDESLVPFHAWQAKANRQSHGLDAI